MNVQHPNQNGGMAKTDRFVQRNQKRYLMFGKYNQINVIDCVLRLFILLVHYSCIVDCLPAYLPICYDFVGNLHICPMPSSKFISLVCLSTFSTHSHIQKCWLSILISTVLTTRYESLWMKYISIWVCFVFRSHNRQLIDKRAFTQTSLGRNSNENKSFLLTIYLRMVQTHP